MYVRAYSSVFSAEAGSSGGARPTRATLCCVRLCKMGRQTGPKQFDKDAEHTPNCVDESGKAVGVESMMLQQHNFVVGASIRHAEIVEEGYLKILEVK